jgi:hypothetical protein
MENITVEQVRQMSAKLSADIERLVQEFESQTGTFVHSIPVTPGMAGKPPLVAVKVQVTQPR